MPRKLNEDSSLLRHPFKGEKTKRTKKGTRFYSNKPADTGPVFLCGRPDFPGTTLRPMAVSMSVVNRVSPSAKLPLVALRISSTRPGSSSHINARLCFRPRLIGNIPKGIVLTEHISTSDGVFTHQAPQPLRNDLSSFVKVKPHSSPPSLPRLRGGWEGRRAPARRHMA